MKIKNKILFYLLGMYFFYLMLGFAEFFLRPLFNDFAMAPASKEILTFLFFVFGGILTIYILFFNENKEEIKSKFKLILLFFIIFQLTLLFITPLGSGDIYNYLYYTKTLTSHGQNPFLVAPNNFPDPLRYGYADISIMGKPLVYGPFWLAVNTIPTYIAQNSIYLGMFLIKFLSIIFNSLSLLLIFKIAEIINQKRKYFISSLYALNPLILFETAGNGHNDIIMVFLILLTIYLTIKNKYLTGFFALSFSVFIKYISLLLLPVFFIFYQKKKFWLILAFGLSSLMAYLIIGMQAEAIWSLKTNFGFSNITHFSPLIFLAFLLKTILELNIDQNDLQYFGYFAFAIFYIFLTIKIYNNKNKNSKQIIKYSFFIFLAYLVLASVNILPWHFLWVISLGLFFDKWQKTMLFLTALGVSYYGLFTLPIAYIFSLLGFIFIFLIKKLKNFDIKR